MSTDVHRLITSIGIPFVRFTVLHIKFYFSFRNESYYLTESKNLYRTIAKSKGGLHVHNFSHKAVNTNQATKKFPKEFLCMSLVKSVVTCESVYST
jgi:hypothetical protein